MKRLLITCALIIFTNGALAQSDCEVSIESNDQIQYNKSELKVSSDCEEVTLTLKHVGKLPKASMGHNVVITASDDMQAVSQAAMGALDNDYIPAGDDRILAHTNLIGGGEETTMTFDISDWDLAGDYTFFCSFPGHSGIMKGQFIIE